MDTKNKFSAILIDDEHPARLRIKSLAANHAETIEIVGEAKNGKEAIRLINELKPGLIFLDINMPGMNGFEIYNEIQKDEDLKNLPAVIFTTAAFFKGNQRKGNEDLPIFIKPDKIKDFTACIQKILTHCKD